MQSAIQRLTENHQAERLQWGIGDKSIPSVGTDLRATTLEMVDAMVDEDSAIVSIYFGSDSDEDSANELAAAIEEKYPDVEVGGQRWRTANLLLCYFCRVKPFKEYK